ncbi:MAG: TIGR03619 family F420-dependent LLM class oxidoreductase [Alphaproteobacteria bacterium]
MNWTAEAPDDWGYLIERARAAEEAGIDRVVVSDHVIFGADLDAYGKPERGGILGGRQPTGPDGCWLEPMTSLAVLAGATSRVRLCTGVLLAALRRPAVLAKEAATLDVLSGGRLDLGVGIGWQREEYDAVGLDYGNRGRLLDHTLEVCQRLWQDRRASYASDELRFDGIHMMPKPVSPGGVPVWVSGTLNDRVLARLARFGAGWVPWGADLADLPTSIGRMREGVAALGRDPSGIGVVGSVMVAPDERGVIDAAATMADVPGLLAAGVTDVRLFMGFPAAPGSRGALVDQLVPLVSAFRDTAR